MTMTIDQRHGDEAAMSPPATTDRRAVLRRMGDLKSVIARLKGTSSRLSAEGGSTEEIDRIIDILVSTLALIRGYHGDLEDDETAPESARATS
jgi:hypothetical protein